MTNRIFTLPSGRQVVLKAPSLDALTELHGLAVFFKDRMAQDMEQERQKKQFLLHGQINAPRLLALAPDVVSPEVQQRQQLHLDSIMDTQRSLKIEDVVIPEILAIGYLVLTIHECKKHNLRHPRETFGNSLDSFNSNAKKLCKL